MRFFDSNLIRILLILLVSCEVSAAESTFTAHPAVVFAQDRARDALRLLEGPQPPAPRTAPRDLSCTELYERRVTLMRQTRDYRPGYWDDPRNKAAIFIGTIYNPAFYFLAYSGITEYLETARGTADDIRTELDSLRYASAYKQCFVR